MIHFLQAIVFDFDGVITDSEPIHLRAIQDALVPEGITLEPADYYSRYLGYDDYGVFVALAQDRGVRFDERTIAALLARKAERFRELGCTSPVLFDGAAARIREWSAVVPLAIASGALRAEIEQILDVAGLRGCFRAIVGADDVRRSKPAPEPYQRAVHMLGGGEREVGSGVWGVGSGERKAIDAHRAVAIEDSRWGIESAAAAGLRTVAITNSYAASELQGADLIVEGLDELTLETLDGLCG